MKRNDKEWLVIHLSRMIQMYSMSLQFIFDDCCANQDESVVGYLKMGDDCRDMISGRFEELLKS